MIRPIEDLNRAIQLKPRYADAYTNRGNTYLKKGSIPVRLKTITRRYNSNRFFKPYYNRGNLYYQKGEYDLAIGDYTKAIALNPDDVHAYNNRGVAYRAKGDYDRAIDDFNKAIQLDPKKAEFHNNLGITYRKKGTFHRAIEDHNKAIECNSDFGSAYYIVVWHGYSERMGKSQIRPDNYQGEGSKYWR